MSLEAMTLEEFYENYGRLPTNDDLERVNCDKAGQPGHMLCGLCDKPEHRRCPRFFCGCIAPYKEGTT